MKDSISNDPALRREAEEAQRKIQAGEPLETTPAQTVEAPSFDPYAAFLEGVRKAMDPRLFKENAVRGGWEGMTKDMDQTRARCLGVESRLTREEIALIGESIGYEFNAKKMQAQADDQDRRAHAKRDFVLCAVRERVEADGREPNCCTVFDLERAVSLALPHDGPDGHASSGKTVGGIPKEVWDCMPAELRSALEQIQSAGIPVIGQAIPFPIKKK